MQKITYQLLICIAIARVYSYVQHMEWFVCVHILYVTYIMIFHILHRFSVCNVVHTETYNVHIVFCFEKLDSDEVIYKIYSDKFYICAVCTNTHIAEFISFLFFVSSFGNMFFVVVVLRIFLVITK